MNQPTTVRKTTRSILVIEEEYNLRVLLMEALSVENWNVIFALTEETIEEAIRSVAGVILNWNLPEVIDRDQVLKIIGELPLIVTSTLDNCTHEGFLKIPFATEELVKAAQEKIHKNQFFVGDRVTSKTTPDWGPGRIVSIYPDQFYGVIFKSDPSRRASEIALRCHFTGLNWAKS